MEPTTTMRRPCFIGEDDDGFASISHFSTNNNSNTNNDHVINYQTQPYIMRRKNSLRNIPSFNNMATTTTTTTTLVYSPRTTTRLQSPHFLESCSLCRKPLGGNRDIFMYRGDTPFCSEECRQEQIEIDEAKEKNWNIKSMMRSKNESKKSSSSTTTPPSKPQNYSFRTSTIAAA